VDEVIWVRAADLRMPHSRPNVDLGKLIRQFRQFGRGLDGMPSIEVTRCANGKMFINDGVTRATRAYRYAGPDSVVPVVVIDERPGYDIGRLRRVSDQ
jgi:hypothetical protein